MAQTVANILMGGARVFYAPVATAAPDDDTAYGGTWTSWTEVGFTTTPLAVAMSREEYDIQVQQRIGTVKRRITNEDIILETTLAEVTADNIQLAIGGDVTDTGAGVGQVGKEELDAGGDFLLDERAWGFEGLYVDSSGTQWPARLFIWKATSTMNGNIEFSKEAEAGIPLQIKALVDTSKAVGVDKFQFQRVLAAAS